MKDEVQTLNCTLLLEECNQEKNIYERVSKAEVPASETNSFLSFCNNVTTIKLLLYTKKGQSSENHEVPLKKWPTLTSLRLLSGSLLDAIVKINMDAFHRPLSFTSWSNLLCAHHGFTLSEAKVLHRKQQIHFAKRWSTGDPLAQRMLIRPKYQPVYSTTESLSQEEEDWLSHFYIVENSIQWHVEIVNAEFSSSSWCYQLREKKLIDSIPEAQLCHFYIDACGQPIFTLHLKKQFPTIKQLRRDYVRKKYSQQLAVTFLSHFSLHRINIPDNCLPLDCISLELNAASFTKSTLSKIEKMKSLTHLSLNTAVSKDNIPLLKEYLTTLPHLKKLEICGCGLTTLPSEIGSLHHLEDLFLWGNQLTSLPESMSNLKNLKRLSISNSPVSIPDWVWDSSLQRLYHQKHKLSLKERYRMKSSNVNIVV